MGKNWKIGDLAAYYHGDDRTSIPEFGILIKAEIMNDSAMHKITVRFFRTPNNRDGTEVFTYTDAWTENWGALTDLEKVLYDLSSND